MGRVGRIGTWLGAGLVGGAAVSGFVAPIASLGMTAIGNGDPSPAGN